MATYSQMVCEFHKKFGFAVNHKLSNNSQISVTEVLNVIGEALNAFSKSIRDTGVQHQADGSDLRLYRAHLMVEELGEVLVALATKDEVKFADGLADLSYVVEGTALTFGIPLTQVFEEVHRSNMTKSRPKDDQRMARKGDNYDPPNIQDAIDRGRYLVNWSSALADGLPGTPKSDGYAGIVFKHDPSLPAPVPHRVTVTCQGFIQRWSGLTFEQTHATELKPGDTILGESGKTTKCDRDISGWTLKVVSVADTSGDAVPKVEAVCDVVQK